MNERQTTYPLALARRTRVGEEENLWSEGSQRGPECEPMLSLRDEEGWELEEEGGGEMGKG